MASPRLSVIIPVYNRLELLLEALRSVAAQTLPAAELIVVDDGSEEDLEAAIRRPGAVHAAVKLFRIPHSGMPGKVRNYGAQYARGEYLAFLDSDDLWLPEKTERQLRFHEERSDCVLSHTKERWLRRGKEVRQPRLGRRKAGEIFEEALRKCTIGPSTVILRRDCFEVLGGFREDLEIAEDYELWLRVVKDHPVAYLDETLIVKRAGFGDNLSEKYSYIEPFRLRALVDLLENSAFEGSRRALALREAKRKLDICRQGAVKRGRPLALYKAIEERLVVLDQKQDAP